MMMRLIAINVEMIGDNAFYYSGDGDTEMISNIEWTRCARATFAGLCVFRNLSRKLNVLDAFGTGDG